MTSEQLSAASSCKHYKREKVDISSPKMFGERCKFCGDRLFMDNKCWKCKRCSDYFHDICFKCCDFKNQSLIPSQGPSVPVLPNPGKKEKHPFNESCEFKFSRTINKEFSCIACTRREEHEHSNGYHYYCRDKKEYIHPCCLYKVKNKGCVYYPMLIRENNNDESAIRNSRCDVCLSTGAKCSYGCNTPENGWVYKSNDFEYHIRCLKEVINDNHKKGHFKDFPNTQIDRDAYLDNRSDRKFKEHIKIAKVLLKFFGHAVTSLMGVPIPLALLDPPDQDNSVGSRGKLKATGEGRRSTGCVCL